MSLLVATIRFAVWLSRRVLWIPMFCGQAASCFLARQMEFHADACAMAVVGSAGFESSTLRLRELTVLQSLAYRGMQEFWRHRHKVPDSVADFLEELEKRLPADFHEQALHTLLNEKAGLFTTHPTDCQRIQSARKRAEPGVFCLEKPARLLFRDFAALSRLVTARHYRLGLRLAVTDPMLRPVSEFFETEQPQTRTFKLGQT